MAGTAGAKRKAQETKLRSRPTKKFKKQAHYSSGSESEAEPVDDENPVLAEEGPGSKSKVSSKRDSRKIPPDDEQLDEEAEKAGDEPLSPAADSDADDTAGDEPAEDEDSASEIDSEASDADLQSDSQSQSGESSKRKTTKRRDPDAFASSMSAILSSKLTTSNRRDPVLARSKDAATTAHELAESKLEAKARRKLRDDKRALNEKGRVRDVLLGDRRRTPGLSESEAEDGALQSGGESKAKAKAKTPKTKQVPALSAAEIAEQERRLKKTAQRGVIKLFNAVRAAQVRGEEAAREAKRGGVIGVKAREEKVGEMGRQAFLDLVGAGKVGTA